MAVLIALLGAFCICALVNSFLFCNISIAKLLPWLSSLLPPKPSSPPPPSVLPQKMSSMSRDQLSVIFSAFDRNGDGFITRQELQDSLQSLGLFCSDAQIAAMLQKVDSNQDGLIDMDEFCDLHQDGLIGSDTNDDELREAFDVFDENGDGLITAEELAGVLSSLGLRRGLGECREMIEMVDSDGDGKVDFQEFKSMMGYGRNITIS